MAYISLEKDVPGIRSLVLYRPETGKPLYELVELLLRGESALSSGERELIAAYVSKGNECVFCSRSHAAAARCLMPDESSGVDEVLAEGHASSLSPKMNSLLKIADHVRVSGKNVTEQDIAEAKANGAGDREIHDTVLIAATFCMFNRYVDGLNTLTPTDETVYEAMGTRMASGYKFPFQGNAANQQ